MKATCHTAREAHDGSGFCSQCHITQTAQRLLANSRDPELTRRLLQHEIRSSLVLAVAMLDRGDAAGAKRAISYLFSLVNALGHAQED